jgi:GNAT superfamily N-acetyltransferase
MPDAGHGAVRPALARDAEKLFALAHDMATSFVPTLEGFRAAFSELCSHDDAVVLVAEGAEDSLDGYLLGFVHPVFYADAPIGWVEELAVRSAVRRHGVGRRLLESFEEWAQFRGARLVALATRRAGAFYSANGYEESAAYFRKTL